MVRWVLSKSEGKGFPQHVQLINWDLSPICSTKLVLSEFELSF